jgi:hypothetical protein
VLVATYALLAALLVGLIASAMPAPAHAEESAPQQVIVGAYINDIQELDTERGSFTIDFYIWFRWKSPIVDPTDSIEVMNSNAMENTTSSPTGGVSGRPFPDPPADMPDGSKYQGFRYQGVFSKTMGLHRFPFDIQQLTVQLEDIDQDDRELEFVPDTGGVGINDDLTIPGFEIGTPTLTVVSQFRRSHRPAQPRVFPDRVGGSGRPGCTALPGEDHAADRHRHLDHVADLHGAASTR